jgi:hypothetical protein
VALGAKAALAEVLDDSLQEGGAVGARRLRG